jgi:hypothetical protein
MNIESSAAVADGKILGDALLSAPSAVLATAIVLIRETHLFPVLVSRIKAVVRWQEDEFQKELATQTETLAKRPPGQLALELILEFNRALDIHPRNYVARRDIDDNAAELVAKTLEILRKAIKISKDRACRIL